MLIPSTLSAQTVYFGNISNKTSVGLGIDGNVVTLSLMEINKSKNFDSFDLRLYDMNGQSLDISMAKDTLYHLDLDKKYAHQQDYKLSMRDYLNLKASLNSQSYVKINGDSYNGAAFTGILRSLEYEQRSFLSGNLMNVRKVSIWSWQRGLQFMRFKGEAKGFRYIRKG
jgi:hypothetical protein